MLTRKKTLLVAIAAGSAVVAVYVARQSARGRWRPGGLHPRRRLTGDSSRLVIWRFDHQFRALPAGKVLRLEFSSPAIVHWTVNQWDTVQDTQTTEVTQSVHAADLPTGELPPNARLQFTFYWPRVNRWEGQDFELKVEPATEEVVRTALDKSE